MSTISKRSSVQTLKGIFTVPKQTHARNFLRENKISLRDMQRLTDKKDASLTENIRLNKRIPQAPPSINRRSASQHHMPNERVQNSQTRPRSRSQQKQQEQQQLEINKPCPTCAGGDGAHVGAVDKKTHARSKLIFCDREIQTDDISDEVFLHDALKKCGSSKIHYRNDGAKSGNVNSYGHEHVPELQMMDANNQDDFDGNDELPLQSGESGDDLSARSFQTVYENHKNMSPSMRSQRSQASNVNGDNLPASTRTHYSHSSRMNGNMNGHLYDEEELNNNMDAMSLKSKRDQEQQLMETQSIHSRQTVHSTLSQGSLSKKRAAGSVHKLGSRDDVRLPRYLEREKREKEEQRVKELGRDPNCPPGHIILSEEERLAAQSGAQKKFDGLISELNHMPMTNQTLRVRTRKSEIEKELAVIEMDIRAFSKPKVYVKVDE